MSVTSIGTFNSGHRLYVYSVLAIDCISANYYLVWRELGQHLPGNVHAHPYMSLVSAWLSAALIHTTIACRPIHDT